MHARDSVTDIENGSGFIHLHALFIVFNLIFKNLADFFGFYPEDYKYLHNFLSLPAALTAFLAGTVMVLYGVTRTALSKVWTAGVWWSGIGTVLVVMSLFWVAGYADTPYYPSLLDASSSLTIYNSSSSRFTLTAMSWVSLIIPFVLAYIVCAWRSMDRKD